MTVFLPEDSVGITLNFAINALRDIRQAIWTDERGIERVDMGCIKEALERVFGAETCTCGDPRPAAGVLCPKCADMNVSTRWYPCSTNAKGAAP
jgi:hypothetical protein